MKRFPFKKIDAFACGAASGNPAGCIYLDGQAQMTEEEMLQIAKEMKGFVNEVGFLQTGPEELRLRYFSAECEVEFCGHATIAIMHNLISERHSLRDQQEIYLHVGKDRLKVVNEIAKENAVYITAPQPRNYPCALETDQVAAALGTDPTAICTNHPIRIVHAGLKTLIVPITSLAACLEIWPDQETLRLFCETQQIDIVLIFTHETSLPECGYRTRVFAPKYGYLEYPATGSGNSAFGSYLLERSQWNGQSLAIEQGPSRQNPNIVRLRSTTDEHGVHVLFGGASVERISGSYLLHT